MGEVSDIGGIQEIDIRDLDAREAAEKSEFLQSGFWGRFKGAFGWTPRSFRFGATHLLLLTRRVGPLSFAYIPRGPADCGERSSSFWKDLCHALIPLLPKSTLFIRIDMPVYDSRSEDDLARPSFGAPLVKSGADIQPPDTVLLDISQSEESIQAAMKPKTRYNIRLAYKKGVEVRECGAEGLPLWYDLYLETARRDRIAIHGRAYYEALFAVERAGGVHLLMAYAEGKPCAGIIVLLYGEKATYLYGASANEYRNYMPAYALQWEAILTAKRYGCRRYDLYGIPPSDDPSHPMHGLYRFKTGFGGSILRYAGCWDYPVRPVLYRLYRCAETLRMTYYRKLKKLLRRRAVS